MLLPKKYQDFLALHAFCADQKVEARDAVELVVLANRAFSAAACGNNREQPAMERFVKKAKSLGFGVQWPGLWPSLLDKDGRTVYLPSV